MTDNFKQVFFQMNVANMLHSKASRQDATLFISVQRTGTYSLQKKKNTRVTDKLLQKPGRYSN